jgi:hypothetical protein
MAAVTQFYLLIGGCLLSIVFAIVVQVVWTRRRRGERRGFSVDERQGD